MDFMKPEIVFGDFLRVEDHHGAFITCIPAEIVNLSFREPDNIPIDELTDAASLSEVKGYCQGEIPASIKITRGKYFARLSASGFMDRTEWAGPFNTEEAAKTYLVETYDCETD